MRRLLVVLCLVVALCVPSVASAQKKPKDPVLQTYLEEQFAELHRKLGEISDHVTSLEAEIAKIKQQQADTVNEIRSAQNIARSMDTSLSNYRVTNAQDIGAVKQDVAKIRQDLAALMEGAKKAEAAQEAAKLEGYINIPPEDGKDICTINKGLSDGVKVGMRFAVFKAGDAATQIGLLEITEVLNANNSRAKIIQAKLGAKLEFSDRVRAE
ncbi:MAG TPA: hypothetical protein VGQ11_04880 [Candidatus Acidoferrales bacterium]|nr:hypothetical protein [Candidatus Acidoferrales bacterium]